MHGGKVDIAPLLVMYAATEESPIGTEARVEGSGAGAGQQDCTPATGNRPRTFSCTACDDMKAPSAIPSGNMKTGMSKFVGVDKPASSTLAATGSNVLLLSSLRSSESSLPVRVLRGDPESLTVLLHRESSSPSAKEHSDTQLAGQDRAPRSSKKGFKDGDTSPSSSRKVFLMRRWRLDMRSARPKLRTCTMAAMLVSRMVLEQSKDKK